MQECFIVLCSHHFYLILLMLRLIHRFIISDCNFSCFFSISFFLSSLCFIFVRACVVSFGFFFQLSSHLIYSIDSWLLPSCSTICFILSFSWCQDNNMWAFCYIFYYARFTLEHPSMRWCLKSFAPFQNDRSSLFHVCHFHKANRAFSVSFFFVFFFCLFLFSFCNVVSSYDIFMSISKVFSRLLLLFKFVSHPVISQFIYFHLWALHCVRFCVSILTR